MKDIALLLGLNTTTRRRTVDNIVTWVEYDKVKDIALLLGLKTTR